MDCHSNREKQTKCNVTLHHHPTVAGEIIDRLKTVRIIYNVGIYVKFSIRIL